MTILVFGGSSQIGRFLLPALCQCDAAVLAVSRSRRREDKKLLWVRGCLPDALPTMPLENVSAIISCGPLLALAQWLSQVHLPRLARVIATSSMSAQTKQHSPVAAERAIAHQLRLGESRLATICTHHDWDWMVLRPTLIYGAGMDRSLTPIAHLASRWRFFPMPAGRGLRQPVHAADIAQAMQRALDVAPTSLRRVLALGGGERLSAAQMFARVRRSLAVRTVPLPLPRYVVRGAKHMLPILRGPLGRLDMDLVADNTEIIRLLGVHPRPFRPNPGCWQTNVSDEC